MAAATTVVSAVTAPTSSGWTGFAASSACGTTASIVLVGGAATTMLMSASVGIREQVKWPLESVVAVCSTAPDGSDRTVTRAPTTREPSGRTAEPVIARPPTGTLPPVRFCPAPPQPPSSSTAVAARQSQTALFVGAAAMVNRPLLDPIERRRPFHLPRRLCGPRGAVIRRHERKPAPHDLLREPAFEIGIL